MKDRQELIKALELISQTCMHIPSWRCNNGDELGDCPIYEILKECPKDITPDKWVISE